MMLVPILIGCGALSQWTNAHAQTGTNSQTAAADSDSQRVDRLMADWNRADFPGAAIAVCRDDRMIYSKGFGSAQLEYEIPITPQTIFHVAFTARN